MQSEAFLFFSHEKLICLLVCSRLTSVGGKKGLEEFKQYFIVIIFNDEEFIKHVDF